MRIGIAGAGPAGLLFAYLAKSRRADVDVRVVEQNARDATFGFGVVFSHGALEFLARDVPAMHAALATVVETWPIQRIVHRDHVVDIDGNGFCATGRLPLLRLLQAECERVGVALVFETRVGSADAFADCDLVVGADGVNSAVRRADEAAFRPTIEWLTNKFVWYGTTKTFECLTLTFRGSEHGAFVAHHYRYAPDRSTFIVECDALTWRRAGFDTMDDAASRAYCERVFAADLDGHPLIGNRSTWRNFPLIRCANWHAGNVVLIGDALRTGHFSIGSGTRLAFDDAIGLDRAFAEAGDDVSRLLAASERERRPIVDKLVIAANASSYWYERMADKMAFDPVELAYDYMTRSGRMSDERLAETAARFMSEVRARGANRRCIDGRMIDPVADDMPGAREIGFAVPECYNASHLLYDNLATRSEKVALVCGERRFTYRELCALANRVGNGLAAMGLARGGRVLMLQDDGPEYVAAIFGAIRAFRAGARQHAFAAGTRRLFPSGQRCRSGVCRQAHCGAARSRRRPIEPPSPDRSHRRRYGKRHACACTASSVDPLDRSAGDVRLQRRHASRRDGVLDVQLGLDRAAQGRCPLAARRALHVARLRPRRAGHRPARHSVLAAEDLLRVRLRQFADVSVRRGRDRRIDARPSRTSGGVRHDRATPADGAVRIAHALRRDGRASRLAAPRYWNRADKTAATMRDGWIYTGDRFRCDRDGFHFFEGRADDLVKVSGQWVHPVEVERCLAEHPLVRECAVLALDDENRLKTLVAFVALHDGRHRGDQTTRGLQTFVKERLLPYKYPRSVVYMDTLPKTGTGKIDRQALKRRQ